MSTRVYLTDELSEISGYLRASLGRRSEIPSLVRAVTATLAGPTAGIQATRSSGGTELAWLTDPLTQDDLSASTWEHHLWAAVSLVSVNAQLRVKVFRWTFQEEAAPLLDESFSVGIQTTMRELHSDAGVLASATALAAGDRLAIRVFFDDAPLSTMGVGTATLAYNGQFPRAEGDTWLLCPDNLRVLGNVPLDTIERVRRNLKDRSQSNPNLQDDELRDAVSEALWEYTRVSPWVTANALSGDGTLTEFNLPGRWIPGLSVMLDLEHPTGEQMRRLVEGNDWEIVEGHLGVQPTRYLRFVTGVPELGTDNIRLRYTTRHVHTDELDTVPAHDFDAFCWLASSFAALKMAAKAAASSDSTIAADSVNRRDAEQRWHSVATELRKLYEVHMGIGGSDGKSGQQPAGITTEWDQRDRLHTMFWHSSRTR